MANEKRLIDANALLEKAYLTHPATMVNPYGGDYVVSVEDIENAPTVDAVEVVRCKDCVHMKKQFNGRFCDVWCLHNGDGDEGFCNYGERKDDGK